MAGLQVGRRLGGAVDATVGRVGSVARGLTQDTARQVVEDLTPQLVEETLPQILEALTPRLVEETLPQILEGLLPRIIADLAPRVVDGLTPHLVDRTVPAVLEGVTPALADELLPAILDRLLPFLAEEYVPALVDAVTPQLVERTVPEVVAGVLPGIRTQVVPLIVDDIAADPRVRDLIRKQSLGLLLDAHERFRRTLARGDDALDRVAARLRRPRTSRPAGPGPVSLPAGSGPVSLPAGSGPVAPPGRGSPYAGAVTRGVGIGLDLGLLALLGSVGLASVLGLLDALPGTAPDWPAAVATALFGAAAPAYLTLCWWATGTTAGALLAGSTVRSRGGGRPGFAQALLRAWLVLLVLPLWALGLALSPLHARRAAWHDRLTGTQVLYLPAASGP